MGNEHSKCATAGSAKGGPPPYSAASASDTKDLLTSRRYPDILASDTPRWRWNSIQCQEWLTLAIKEYCGRSQEDADRKAREFLRGGFAPLLYMASYDVWTSHIGEDGAAIFSFLQTVRKDQGAVPNGIHFSMYEMKPKPKPPGRYDY